MEGSVVKIRLRRERKKERERKRERDRRKSNGLVNLASHAHKSIKCFVLTWTLLSASYPFQTERTETHKSAVHRATHRGTTSPPPCRDPAALPL